MCNAGVSGAVPRGRAFVLSPASLGGVRGRRLLAGASTAPALVALSSGGAVALGDVYASISSLYFRGKLAYARHFTRGRESGLVRAITPNRGLRPVDEPVTLEDLRAMADVDIGPAEPRYLAALTESCRALDRALAPGGELVLLGSIATAKYVEPLCEIFGDRLLVPSSFIGRGDMSRGGLLLRAVDTGEELAYEVARTAARRGPRPPRLGRRAQPTR